MKDTFFEQDKNLVTESDKAKIRNLIHNISEKIYNHEIEHDKLNSRTHIKIPTTDNIILKCVDNKKYYYYFTNIFYGLIIDNILLDAATEYPDLFGTGNSEDVIKAINNIRPVFCTDDSIYKEEQYCYIVEENEKGELNENNILKIQLFRFQELTDKKDILSKNIFTGGLFHAYKHFRFHDKSISTDNKGFNFDHHPSYFLFYITQAFFKSELKKEKDANGRGGLCGIHENIKFFFFPVDISNLKLCFLTTAYPNSSKPTTV
jgi:hypothetical protein